MREVIEHGEGCDGNCRDLVRFDTPDFEGIAPRIVVMQVDEQTMPFVLVDGTVSNPELRAFLEDVYNKLDRNGSIPTRRRCAEPARQMGHGGYL